MTIQEKLARLVEATPWMTVQKLQRRISGVMNENISARVARMRIIKIATEANDALAPIATCRNGCSHCCHQGLVVFEHEAVALAKVSGREMVKQPHRSDRELEIDIGSATGKPCPFLTNNSCSVYEHRPLSCRLRHSLNEKASDCSENGSPIGTYSIDDFFVDPYVELSYRIRGVEPLGSVHRYFPER